MTNAELARRSACRFREAESAEGREVADVTRYRWRTASRFPPNAKLKTQVGAEIDLEMQ